MARGRSARSGRECPESGVDGRGFERPATCGVGLVRHVAVEIDGQALAEDIGHRDGGDWPLGPRAQAE